MSRSAGIESGDGCFASLSFPADRIRNFRRNRRHVMRFDGLSMTAVWILIKWRLPESKRLDGHCVVIRADGKWSLPESMRRRHIERMAHSADDTATDVVGVRPIKLKLDEPEERKKMAQLTSTGAGDGAQSCGTFAALAASVTTQTRGSRRLDVVVDAHRLHGSGRDHR